LRVFFFLHFSLQQRNLLSTMWTSPTTCRTHFFETMHIIISVSSLWQHWIGFSFFSFFISWHSLLDLSYGFFFQKTKRGASWHQQTVGPLLSGIWIKVAT
jgi:hypothetical protein